MNSKQKGKRGELELARLLRSHGFKDCRRGQQYNGLEGQDVVGLPYIHIECKRRENLNIYQAMEQSLRDRDLNNLPFCILLATVMHRKNECEWLVTMTFEDWKELFKHKMYGTKEEQEFRYIFDYGTYKDKINARWLITNRLKLYDEISLSQRLGNKDLLTATAHATAEMNFLITMTFNDWIILYKEWLEL